MLVLKIELEVRSLNEFNKIKLNEMRKSVQGDGVFNDSDNQYANMISNTVIMNLMMKLRQSIFNRIRWMTMIIIITFLLLLYNYIIKN